MPPKKRPGKELPTEDSSQAVEAHVLETATQPQTTMEPHLAIAKIRRPKEPPHQPTTQAEVAAINTSIPNTQQPTQHKDTEVQEDQQQDSKGEIDAVIEDELAHLHQEKEHLQLMQE
jgi:hypothetical protein